MGAVTCKPGTDCCHQIRHQVVSARSSSGSLSLTSPPPPETQTHLPFPSWTGETRVFQSHNKRGSISPVMHWCLDGYSPMKGSEALSLTLILSSLCPVLVSSHLTRWHRTITSQRYFLNVSSGGEGFPVGPRQPESEGGTPVIDHAEPQHKRMAGCSPRPDGCRCQSWHERRTVGKNEPDDDSGLNIYLARSWTAVMILLGVAVLHWMVK